MGKIPQEINKKRTDVEILRTGIIAELDAINLYEQMATLAKNKKVKETLLDIAREEKAHVGEFEALLFELDKEQVSEYEKGRREVKELR